MRAPIRGLVPGTYKVPPQPLDTRVLGEQRVFWLRELQRGACFCELGEPPAVQ